MDSKEMAFAAVKLLDSKKAKDIVLLDILEISTVGDYFIIASGGSTSHAKSLVDELDDMFGKAGINAKRIEGKDTSTWVLMDYLDLVIHIFNHETREFYGLERLWGDAVTVDISDMLTED